MRWLMIGTAPSVLDWLPRMDPADYDATITTNGGIRLEPTPTYYVLIDMAGCEGYHDEAKAAQDRGTVLVTLQRDAKALASRKVDHFDDFVSISEDKPSQARYGKFRYSGPFCLEYACHHGATRIDLVGFDGYRSDMDYFSNDLVKRRKRLAKYAIESTRDYVAPACSDIATAWPGVRFVRYGNPAFSVRAPNWEDVTA